MAKVKQVWLLAGLCICSMGVYDTLLTWLPQVLSLKGLPPTEASFAASVLPVGFLLAGPIVGTLSDRLGRRKPFLWMLSIGSAAFVAALPGFGGFGLWGLIALAGFGLSGVLTLVLVISTEHPGTRGHVGSAVGLVTSLGNIGSFFFPIITGYIIDLTAAPGPPLAALAVFAGAAALLTLRATETGRRKPEDQ